MKPLTTALAGIAIALAAVALFVSTSAFALGAGLLVGIAAGAAVALVPGETGPRKIAGLVTGILVTAGAYVLRAGLLPDAMIGTIIGIVALVAIITVVALVTRNRAPLWASFAGVAAMAGAYETLHIQDFAGLMANLPVATATVLLASAVGFTAASFFAPAKTRTVQALAPEAAEPQWTPTDIEIENELRGLVSV